MSRNLIIGPTRFASYQMRGLPLQRELRWPHQDSRKPLKLDGQYDTALVVKWYYPKELRKRTERIIWDPLDSYWNRPREIGLKPSDYWKCAHYDLQFDEVVATSPACAATMRAGLPTSVKVHIVPHAADSRIDSTWHDSDGPVVFAGCMAWLKSPAPIKAACKRIGKRFVLDKSFHSWKSLKGASLQLCIRTARCYSLHWYCKPQIKMANSAAGGIPAVSTDIQAATSLWPEAVTCHPQDANNPQTLAAHMLRALDSPPPQQQFTEADWIATMKVILNA